MEHVTGASWAVYREAVPPQLCDQLAHRLLLELRRRGVTAEEVASYSSSTWWPWLRDELPELRQLASYLEELADTSGSWRWCEPQLLLRLPDEPDTAAGGGHTDTLPPWAPAGASYRCVYGVELTDGKLAGGGTVLLPEGDDGPQERPQLLAGDVLAMGPQLLHRGSPNLRGHVRMAVFYRQLQLPDAPS